MPLEQVSNSLTFYAFFTYTKQGVTGLTVTADVYRNGVSILTTQACTAVGGGLYSYTLASASVNAEGEYICLFKTAGTVDQQHIPAIWCIAKAGVEYLDAQVTSRAAIADYTTVRAAKLDNLDATVTSRLASGNVTVGSYAAGQDPATLVWAAGTRTLTGFGFSVTVGTNNDKTGYALAVTPPTVANIWDAATSGMATVGSVGKRIADYVDATVSSRLATSGYTAPDNTSIGTILSRTDVATSTRASATDYTTARAAKIDNLDAAISSRLAPAGITNLQADVTAIKTPVIANVDATISSRLASSAYTPTTAMSADVATILSRTDVATSTRASATDYTTARAAKLDNLDATISSRLAPAGITNLQADVTAIKTPVIANVDATISSRLASSAYTPTTAISADVATILSRTDVATSSRASATDYTTARAAKLDRLDVAVSTRVSAGIGSTACPITVTDSAGAPIDGVAVWITTDAGGTNVVAGTRYTGGNGIATFWLDPGTYYAWLQRDGYDFDNPREVTV